jgi:hypothetical protein
MDGGKQTSESCKKRQAIEGVGVNPSFHFFGNDFRKNGKSAPTQKSATVVILMTCFSGTLIASCSAA